MADAGLFGPESVIWRVNREGVLLLGGGRALILQVAHPLVAAGVAEHSNYREDPWGRLQRTLDITYRVVFGDTDTAETAARQLWLMHGRVEGETRENGGRYPAGTPYRAHDPELLMWVHATLVDTSLLVYERYVGQLSSADRLRYYDEQRLLGEKFGVPLDRQPATYGEFQEYVADMLASDRIAVTDALRDVVDATMHPRLPFVAWPVIRTVNLATVGMLPPGLRRELGLAWGPKRERLLRASRRVLRNLLPLVPDIARHAPPARSAARRAAA